MAAILELPASRTKDDRERLNRAFEAILRPSLTERNINLISWWITESYLRGHRRFDFIDYPRGELEISWEDSHGDTHMRWEEPLTIFETEIGRLSRLDTGPHVKKMAHSLESLRNAAISQVVLNQQLSLIEESQIKLGFINGVIMYGTYGIASWPDLNSDNPLGHVVELIPPWELAAVPAGTMNPTDRRAILRSRLFPLAQLHKIPGIKIPDNEAELDIIELPYASASAIRSTGGGPGMWPDGAMPYEFTMPPDTGVLSRDRRGAAKGKEKPLAETEKFVRLRELWILAPNNIVVRYIARAGKAIVQDIKYWEEENEKTVPFPIGIARYHDTGHFYGRSLSSKVIPFSLELENLLERLIEGMADMDRFGYLMVPNTLGIDHENFKATEGPRIVPFEPDLASPDIEVRNIAPTTANDIPGRVLQFGLSLLDRITAQGPLYGGRAPGRADSGEAFGVLAETGSTNLLGPAQRIENAYVTMYRSMLFNVKRGLSTGSAEFQGIPLTKIENTIAGVQIDVNNGTVRLDPAMLPDPLSVQLSIRSSNPVALERRRTEALAMYQQGLLSPMDFIIANYREGWDYPIGNKAVWENYVKAALINLIMFNDGVTPGELPNADLAMGNLGVFFNETSDKPEVHLVAIEDFIAGPEFSLASSEVQDAFYNRVNELKARMGQRLPEQMPPLEEAAVQRAAQMQAMDRMKRGAGQPAAA